VKQVFRRPWVGFGLQAPRARVPHTPYTRCPVSRDVQVGGVPQGTHTVSVG